MTLTHITSENFEQEVKKSDLPVIIDFYADWCGPCQMMAPVFEKVSREYEGKLKFVKVDTQENSDVAEKFEIQGIPALVIAKNGEEVDRIVGFSPEDVLKQKIDEILSSM